MSIEVPAVTRARILIVDDEALVRHQFRLQLEGHYELLDAPDGERCLDVLDREKVDLVLLDQNLLGISGIEVLETMRRRGDDTPVVFVSALNDLPTAIAAMKAGAADYFEKSRGTLELLTVIQRTLAKASLHRENELLAAELEEYRRIDVVRSRNPLMLAIDDLVRKVAHLPTTVLILGESGTGKEVVARQIYQAAGNRRLPFVPVNMATIPRDLVESILFGHERGSFTGAVRQQIGKFELASGGMLFMDEIGELPLDLQSKLLRVIQEGEFERVGGMKTIRANVRLIAATNKDLPQAVARGEFREDLFYRLNVVPIYLPPLRERREDISVLAEHFVRKFARRFRKPVRCLTDDALQMLVNYNWPGNVRELENLIERLVAVCDGETIDAAQIPVEYQLTNTSEVALGNLAHALDAFERNYIQRALQQCQGRRTDTARLLGIPLSTLKYKMRRLKLQ